MMIPLIRPITRTDGADNQDHHEMGMVAISGNTLLAFFHRLQQGCCDHRRRADSAPCGKVSVPRVTISPANAQRNDNTYGRLSQNVTQVQQT